MYASLSYPIHSPSLSQHIHPSSEEEWRFEYLSLLSSLFILSLISPMLGLLDSSLGPPHDKWLSAAHRGMHRLLLRCLFVSFQEWI